MECRVSYLGTPSFLLKMILPIALPTGLPILLIKNFILLMDILGMIFANGSGMFLLMDYSVAASMAFMNFSLTRGLLIKPFIN